MSLFLVMLNVNNTIYTVCQVCHLAAMIKEDMELKSTDLNIRNGHYNYGYSGCVYIQFILVYQTP